jgi:hypothetical protein
MAFNFRGAEMMNLKITGNYFYLNLIKIILITIKIILLFTYLYLLI